MRNEIKIISPEEAVKVIKSGDHVHISSVSTSPVVLIDAMVERGRRGELRDVFIHHIHTEGNMAYASPEFNGIFTANQFFVGVNMRKITQEGYADYIPCFLSDIGLLYSRGELPCNVLMLQCSEPDRHGFVSMGSSVDLMPSVLETKPTIIACINKRMPRTLGDSFIHVSEIDYFCEHEEQLYLAHCSAPTPEEVSIGKHCAGLIEDGACLQMGIGSIPNALLSQLKNHKDLGVHTEMFTDGILPLYEAGVVNGKKKKIDIGKIVTTFCLGSQNLYDFIDMNPAINFRPATYTNDPFVIAQNPKVAAVNSAIQVDITGQVCADSIGTRFFSGVGGQVDFVYGASRSEGGISIIAMQSQTKNGVSKIAPTLDLGAGVVTSRPNVHYVVTEYGAVNLRGKSMEQRAKLLTAIAHPNHREALEKEAFARFGPHYSYILSHQ